MRRTASAGVKADMKGRVGLIQGGMTVDLRYKFLKD